jgi:hypothetical protein
LKATEEANMDNTVVPFSDRQREADLALLLAAVSDLHPAAPSSSCLLQPTSVDMNADHGELQKMWVLHTWR